MHSSIRIQWSVGNYISTAPAVPNWGEDHCNIPRYAAWNPFRAALPQVIVCRNDPS
jgi:hypothetical protein